jgi:hypothetical protein
MLSGTQFVPLSDSDYWVNIKHSQKPIVVLFYGNHDEHSRRLATRDPRPLSCTGVLRRGRVFQLSGQHQHARRSRLLGAAEKK